MLPQSLFLLQYHGINAKRIGSTSKGKLYKVALTRATLWDLSGKHLMHARLRKSSRVFDTIFLLDETSRNKCSDFVS